MQAPGIDTTISNAGACTDHDCDQTTAALRNFAIAREDVPEIPAFEIIKPVTKDPDGMVRIHWAASETVLTNRNNNTFIPFHPGAAGYSRKRASPLPTPRNDLPRRHPGWTPTPVARPENGEKPQGDGMTAQTETAATGDGPDQDAAAGVDAGLHAANQRIPQGLAGRCRQAVSG